MPDLSSIPARRGVYTAERAAQLSGVPRTTVYYWARTSKLVLPSISPDRVKLWSYQDLVLLRFTAWLRRQSVSVEDAREVIRRFRAEAPASAVRASGGRVFVAEDVGDIVDLLSGQALFEGVASLLPEFTLDSSEVPELGRRKLWGPSLVAPSPHTRLDPDVLAGEPFVKASRIPTASLFALTRRSLSAGRIAELYGLDSALVDEALWLEGSMHAGKKLPIAA